MFLCRQKLSLSYVKIGEVFSRDHSTVISSIRAVSQKLEEPDRENDVSCAVQELMKQLSSAYQSLDFIVD